MLTFLLVYLESYAECNSFKMQFPYIFYNVIEQIQYVFSTRLVECSRIAISITNCLISQIPHQWNIFRARGFVTVRSVGYKHHQRNDNREVKTEVLRKFMPIDK
jgi:hypothetical protein